MSQLTGIKPTRTLGQCIGELLNRPIHTRPPVRDAYERPLNTGRRSAAFTGIPGILHRGKVYTVTSHEDCKRIHLGSFVNLRTALQVLADHKGCQPWELRAVSRTMWEMIRAREKYEPRKTARDITL